MQGTATSQRRIHRLSLQLANQIAAGEVIERPASVLKELIENSLDAGAARVEIDVEGSGLRLIRVSDDGAGIHRDDLTLAVSRHATSKITHIDDVHRLNSLGFRGEALASIASVARLQIVSRQSGAEMGWRLRADPGGEQTAPEPASRAIGTTVDVQDLFYNVPARRKFLRSERTEYGHLEDVVKRMILSHLEVAFVLRHQRRVVVEVPPASDPAGHARRVAAIFGRRFLDSARWLCTSAAGMQIWGWLGLPNHTRSQSDLQYLYVNGRVVRDRLLGHAVRHAYHEMLPAGRHPVFALHLELDPTLVDVNVHPTKHEVRFRDANAVHDFVFTALRRTLAEPQPLDAADLPTRAPAPAAGAAPEPTVRRARTRLSVGETLGYYAATAPSPRPGAQPDKGDGLGRLLSIVAERYVLAARAGQVIVVDSWAGQRLLWRRSLEAALAEGGISERPLLIPRIVDVPADQAACAERAAAAMQGFGLDVSRVADTQVLVRALPLPMGNVDAEALVRVALGSGLFEGGYAADAGQVLDALVSVPGVPPREDRGAWQRLLDELGRAFGPEAAGHSGPCWISLSAETLAKLFASGGIAEPDVGDPRRLGGRGS